MCGIFGFVSSNGRGPDIPRLKRIAAETETRGRHAFGLVWIDPHGRLHVFKRPGAASDDLGDLELCGDCRAMLIVRRCRPLAVATTRQGLYFASLPHELPAPPSPVNDNFAAVYSS